MPDRYPLAALQWLRRRRVDREALALSERLSRSARARAEESAARASREDAQGRLLEIGTAERGRLEDGAVRAGELTRVGDWEKAARAEVAERTACEARAAAARKIEVAAELAVRRALAVANSQADVIDAHRAEWSAERAALQERVLEEESLEQWVAKRYPPRG